jgi:hypothetical protein
MFLQDVQARVKLLIQPQAKKIVNPDIPILKRFYLASRETFRHFKRQLNPFEHSRHCLVPFRSRDKLHPNNSRKAFKVFKVLRPVKNPRSDKTNLQHFPNTSARRASEQPTDDFIGGGRNKQRNRLRSIHGEGLFE